MDKKLYNTEGTASGSIDLDDSVFACEPSEGSVYYLVNAELANRRHGTASVRTRGEVRGSTQKPWRQKGTGRARSGHKRSPVWRGGGVVFGPQPRDYSIALPKKMKRLAYRSILSMKVKDDDRFKVVEDFSVESGKTKDFNSILDRLVEKRDGKTVFVYASDDSKLKRAGRNLADFKMLSCERLNAHDVFYCKNLVVTADAVRYLNKTLSGGK